MAQPIKHHLVLWALRFHVCLHFQLKLATAIVMLLHEPLYFYLHYTSIGYTYTMSNPDHIRNIHRINRIMGQLKGVEKMIVEKKYCMDILQQTRAVSSAIKSLENNILNKHIDHCLTDAIKKNNKDKNKKISEIQDLLKKINA